MRATFYHRDQIDSGQWDKFVNQSPQNCIYALSGYLDCVCPGWNAIIVKEGEQWLAVMPLNIARKYLLRYSLKPTFVQYLGILFCPLEGKTHHLIYLKKTIIENVIDTIPKSIRLFNHSFSPEFDYFIPFYWHQFEIRPFHSYCLSLENSLDDIHLNFSPSVINGIKKAEKLSLNCVVNNSVIQLSKMMQKSNIISLTVGKKFEKLWEYIRLKGIGFTIYITDPDNRQVYCGGAFIVARNKVIMIASALDYRFKKTGANALLIWYAIQRSHNMEGVTIFDFEGSMIKGIENYNRTFGASPLTYYNISKNILPLPYSIGFSLKEKMARRKKLNH